MIKNLRRKVLGTSLALAGLAFSFSNLWTGSLAMCSKYKLENSSNLTLVQNYYNYLTNQIATFEVPPRYDYEKTRASKLINKFPLEQSERKLELETLAMLVREDLEEIKNSSENQRLELERVSLTKKGNFGTSGYFLGMIPFIFGLSYAFKKNK